MRRFGVGVVLLAVVAGASGWYARPASEVSEASSATVLDAAAKVAEAAASVPRDAGVIRFDAPDLRPTGSWDLPKTYNARVERWIDYLTGPNRDRTRLWLEREGRYGGLIRSQLRERGMPEDLLYLGMIESGLSPKAYSRAHASGLWQFIAATGKRYGLEVSSYVDDRRDPVKATTAALDYLSDLHERFGSWYLAAAAYNSGEGRVERVLRQRAGGERGRDALFWMIDEHLPRETRDYVPLMLAAAHIGKNPGKYGFHEIALQAPLQFERVQVPGGVSLTRLAEAAGVDREELVALNPQLVRGITPPGRTYSLRVPAGSRESVVARVESASEEVRLATVVHRVTRGETMSHIARRYGVDLDLVRSTNAGLDPRRLKVGDRLRVPVTPDAGLEERWVTYRVRRGDSLWEIARRHGVSVAQLRSWNGIGSRIHPGQRIRIGA